MVIANYCCLLPAITRFFGSQGAPVLSANQGQHPWGQPAPKGNLLRTLVDSQPQSVWVDNMDSKARKHDHEWSLKRRYTRYILVPFSWDSKFIYDDKSSQYYKGVFLMVFSPPNQSSPRDFSLVSRLKICTKWPGCPSVAAWAGGNVPGCLLSFSREVWNSRRCFFLLYENSWTWHYNRHLWMWSLLILKTPRPVRAYLYGLQTALRAMILSWGFISVACTEQATTHVNLGPWNQGVPLGLALPATMNRTTLIKPAQLHYVWFDKSRRIEESKVTGSRQR